MHMTKNIRLEEEGFKFVKAGDLLKQQEEKHSKNVKNTDNLLCNCLNCTKKRETCCKSDEDSSMNKNVYRQD